MNLVRTFSDARASYKGTVALVPTMGFFHEGHLALMTAAQNSADTVVVSHFVNPLQFDNPVDLERYPRDVERDMAIAEEAKVDVLFAPTSVEMIPQTPLTEVTVDGLTDTMEGLMRPGHFAGVATIVTKLFAGLQPHLAFFGRKDAQQLAVIRRLVLDLSFPVRVLAHPTVRESDGLALSSRNTLLTSEERLAARELSQGLFAAVTAVEAGERNGPRLESIVRGALHSSRPDYVELASQDRVERLSELDRPSFLAVAARVGKVRLIDNIAFDLVAGEVVADRGLRLKHPSLLYR
ncbi:MAG TPA: pantoate--beta-alanine ligase [Acidimicrobiia bacterium]|nr:pantoate--beta-alanine ligase [Acidimicrobiia bacterium]